MKPVRNLDLSRAIVKTFNCQNNKPISRQENPLRLFSPFATIALLATTAVLMPKAAKADLIGSNVTGAITTHGVVNLTTQFSSPAIVGSGVEFTGAVTDVRSFTYDITADFSATGLTVGITSPTDDGANIGSGFSIYTLTFTDAAFGASMPETSLTCNSDIHSACNIFGGPPSFSNSLIGDTMIGSTLTLNFEAIASGEIFTFQTPAAAPEPGSFALLGTGMLAGIGALRRRFCGVMPS